jgi:hypothetical protein
MRARSQPCAAAASDPVRRRILVSFARTGLGHGRQRSQGAYDIHRSVRVVKSVRPLVANRNALVPSVDVVAVAVGIIAIVRAAIGMAGIGSSGVGCTITVSPPAITMAEASGTAVADRCRASLDRARNRGSVTTAGTDAWRPEIAARTRAGAQARSRTAEAGTGRTARPHGRRTSERRRTAGRDRRRTARPHWRRTGELRKHRRRRQGNRCEHHADRQRQGCFPGHHSLR